MNCSAVFTWTNLLVVVVELDGNESEALDLVPLVTNTVLEEHQLIVGVVVVVDPGKFSSTLYNLYVLKLLFSYPQVWCPSTHAVRNNECIYVTVSWPINQIPFMLPTTCKYFDNFFYKQNKQTIPQIKSTITQFIYYDINLILRSLYYYKIY